MTDFFPFQSPLYASSGSATPELMKGTQGWSPYSSVLYSEDDNLENDAIEMDAHSTKRRSSDFPLPPTREFALKPGVVRATSAMDLAAIRKMQAWTFDVFAKEVQEENRDAMLHVDDLGPLPSIVQRTSVERPSYIQMPVSTVNTLHPKPQVDESAGSEPDEYPFPYMIATAQQGLQQSFSQQAEDDKLQRLQASLSLLNLEVKDDDDTEGETFAKGLEILSPEQGAPSLAEQMAYACGLGNAYSWSSPAPLDFASPAGLFHPVGLLDATTFSLEERKMASRHVRQVVASNGSAPMPRKVSMQNTEIGERAEVGSSWSHGHGDYIEEEVDCNESVEGGMPRSISPLECDHDSASSSVDSFLGSPILNGALSADDFLNSAASSSNNSEVDTPLTCATSVYSDEIRHYNKSEPKTDNYFTRGLERQSKTQSLSHVSLHEFSYLVESDELVRDGTPLSVKDYFNGSTFSPPLESPEVEKIPSLFIGSVPSPSLHQSSIEPSPALESFSMSRSISTGSVLERPRPISRLEPSSFFGGMEMEFMHHQMVSSASTSSIKKLSECASAKIVASSITSGASQHSRNSPDDASIQKSAMSSSRSMSALGERDSASIYSNASSHSRLERLLAELPKKTVSFASTQSELIISNRNSLSGNLTSLSPKALAQVKEACRAKEDHARNIEMDRWYAQEDMFKAVMTQRKTMNSPQKKKLFTISKSHSSKPSASQSQVSKPFPPMKKKLSKLSLRKEINAELCNATHQRRPSSSTVTVPDTARVTLPILLIARTNSQRRRGYTGVPETEPRALALAKMGIYTDAPTRSSKVEAVTKSSVPLEKADLVSMPNGVILIVEEKHVEMSRVLACSP